MSTEANKSLVDRYFREIMNGERIDAVYDLIDPQCVFTIPTLPDPFYGPDGYKKLVNLLRTAFPDLLFTSLDMLAEGDVVVDRWQATGTSLGPFQGAPPNGKSFRIEGIGWYRLANGKFIENRVFEDTLGLLQQIGALPAPVSASPQEINAQLVGRFWEEIWNQGNLKAADDLVSGDFVLYLPAMQWLGPAGLKQWATLIRSGLPDVKFTIEQAVASGAEVVTRWSAKATHTGNLLGIPPTGNAVTMSGISIFRVAGGKIVEDRAAEDTLGLLQQIKAMPLLPPPGPAQPEALISLPGQGRSITALDSTMTVKCSGADTGGAWSLTHLTVPPGFVQQAPPPHFHTRDEEAFYVLEGTITFDVAGKTIRAGSGSLVKFPRQLVHKFSNPDTTPAAVLVIGSPSGIEDFLADIYNLLTLPGQPDMAKLGAIFTRYGLIIAPPPDAGVRSSVTR
jgi:steroid delta-isomerase-like uncharacterized protein